MGLNHVKSALVQPGFNGDPNMRDHGTSLKDAEDKGGGCLLGAGQDPLGHLDPFGPRGFFNVEAIINSRLGTSSSRSILKVTSLF